VTEFDSLTVKHHRLACDIQIGACCQHPSTIHGKKEFGMKTAITVRIDDALLIEARRCARSENRTLTNFIETLLQRRIAEMAPETVADGAGRQTPPKEGAKTKRDDK
jgi:hypothetical protein